MIVLDDHLLRDHLSATAPARLVRLLEDEGPLATTSLYYARLCRSAAASRTAGQLLSDWPDDAVRALLASLLTLPEDVVVLPMREQAWRMGELAHAHGVSTLGAEALAASEVLGARLCVAAADDGPRIRAAARALRVRYTAIRQS